MDILLLAPIGMILCMVGLAALGLPGKPRDRSPAPAPRRAAPPPQAQPPRVNYGVPGGAMPPLPTPPAGYQIAFDAGGRPILVPAGGR